MRALVALLVMVPSIASASFVGFAPDNSYWVSIHNCDAGYHLCRVDPKLEPTWPTAFGDRTKQCIVVKEDQVGLVFKERLVKKKAVKVGPRGEKVEIKSPNKDAIVAVTLGTARAEAKTDFADAKLTEIYYSHDGLLAVADVFRKMDGCPMTLTAVPIDLAPLGRTRSDAERAVHHLITDTFATLAGAKPNLAAFAKDAEFHREQKSATRMTAAALVKNQHDIVEKHPFEAWTEGLRVHVAPDESGAWAQFDYYLRVEYDEGTWTHGLRTSLVFVKSGTGWTIAGGGFSESVSDKYAQTEASTMAGAPVTAKDVDEAPAEIVAAFDKLLVKGKFAEGVSDRADVFAIGSAGETFEGPKYRAAMKLYPRPLARVGKLHGGVNGTFGWAVANIEAAVEGKKPYKIPFRVIFAFENIGGKWLLVHASWAVPLKDPR